jgi:hypothetical protein
MGVAAQSNAPRQGKSPQRRQDADVRALLQTFSQNHFEQLLESMPACGGNGARNGYDVDRVFIDVTESAAHDGSSRSLSSALTRGANWPVST